MVVTYVSSSKECSYLALHAGCSGNLPVMKRVRAHTHTHTHTHARTHARTSIHFTLTGRTSMCIFERRQEVMPQSLDSLWASVFEHVPT
jgi:hypothetical protein